MGQRIRNIGLVVFIICCGPVFPVLFLDAGLALGGGWEATITNYVRTHPPLDTLLAGALLLGVMGFMAHLWWPLGKKKV